VEKFSVIKTLQAIDSAHVCLLMLDAQEGLVDQDLHVLSAVLESGKAAMIVVNKWDGLSEDEKKHVQSILERRLTFVPFVPVRMISAKKGTGVNALFQEIQKVYTSASQPLSTPQLTRILQRLVEEHAPPLVNGRRVKLRYAHPGGNNPPVVVIHGNQLQSLPDNYKRYLSNGFIKYLALEGTPVSVVFKAGRNPYEGKRNTLTPRQLHKRKRLIRHIKK
ncbi:MAG: GTP-binding protein, partial [Legionellaceae bacterium]|nr:GTP-binding protein [Legionellaceae bacterium]